MNRFVTTASILSLLAMSACQTPGENLKADVYHAGQVNQRQDVTAVRIMAVMPARVEVSNQQNKQTAQVAGALLGLAAGVALGGFGGHNAGSALLGGAAGGFAGGAAGSLVPDSALVAGVSLTYKDAHTDKMYNSAQVGRMCEFKVGPALLVATYNGENRVQPNNAESCSVDSK